MVNRLICENYILIHNFVKYEFDILLTLYRDMVSEMISTTCFQICNQDF